MMTSICSRLHMQPPPCICAHFCQDEPLAQANSSIYVLHLISSCLFEDTALTICPLSSVIKYFLSNRSFPFAYKITINSRIWFPIFSWLHFLPSTISLLPFTTKLPKWVVSISFLPLSLEQRPIRLLAHRSRETVLIKVTSDLHFLNPEVNSQTSSYLTYLQNLTLFLRHIFLFVCFFVIFLLLHQQLLLRLLCCFFSSPWSPSIWFRSLTLRLPRLSLYTFLLGAIIVSVNQWLPNLCLHHGPVYPISPFGI